MDEAVPSGSHGIPARRCFVCSQSFRAQRWYQDDRGATSAEYSLLAVLIAAVIAGVVATLGTDISSALQGFVNAF